jgi:BlaI family transcriptional regulator, penicillinase repressor
MGDRPPISRGETAVLKALWDVGKGSISEIYAAMPEDRTMDYSTVQTYVRRLESKGYITATRVGRNKVYRPGVRRSQVIREAVDEFLDRIFDGQMVPMVRHLVDSRQVSSEELEVLTSLVERLREEQDDE